MVAPHAGAWVEIEVSNMDGHGREVAPHAGAWVEMVDS